MKNKNLILGTIVIVGIAVLSACNTGLPETSGEESVLEIIEKSAEADAAFGDSLCTYTGVLSDTDIAGIMEMREEEKLAGDVYSTFFKQYGLALFENISKSEAVHSSAILRLINGYGLVDPALDSIGEFSNTLFNELFAQLTEKGSVSLIEALKVGAFIEEYDINDLMLLLEETENTDVALVFGNLLSGSESHLKAFTNVLALNGENYIPTIISETLYQEILASNTSGNNNSNQYGNGNGPRDGTGTGTVAGQGNNGSGSGTGVGTGQGNNGSASGTGTTAGQENNGSAKKGNGKK